MKKLVSLFFISIMLVSCSPKMYDKPNKVVVDKEHEKEFEKAYKLYENGFKELEENKSEDKFYILSQKIDEKIVKDLLSEMDEKIDELIKNPMNIELKSKENMYLGAPIRIKEHMIIFHIFQNNKIVGEANIMIDGDKPEYRFFNVDYMNHLIDKKGVYEKSTIQKIAETKPYPIFRLVDRKDIKDKIAVDITEKVHEVK